MGELLLRGDRERSQNQYSTEESGEAHGVCWHTTIALLDEREKRAEQQRARESALHERDGAQPGMAVPRYTFCCDGADTSADGDVGTVV